MSPGVRPRSIVGRTSIVGDTRRDRAGTSQARAFPGAARLVERRSEHTAGESESLVDRTNELLEARINDNSVFSQQIREIALVPGLLLVART